MPDRRPSLLDLKDISPNQIQILFQVADQIKSKKMAENVRSKVSALLFFEPSTRTRFSFEMASHRAGFAPLVFDGVNTSLEKGETIEDTIFNIAAMKPDVIVIRCGDQILLREIAKQIEVPILNAGWGIQGHPTQALLDALALRSRWGELQGKKLLIVGDVLHSRVAASHFELMPKLGAEVGVCGPKFLLPDNKPVKTFEKLNEGLAWADAVMALRVQFERHHGEPSMNHNEYFENFGLNEMQLKNLKTQGLILHPGPINYGIEFEQKILSDPRCLVYSQVEHGTYVREALFRWVAGEF
jgi:aspartate carbamoyltransferase catalytic subunit